MVVNNSQYRAIEVNQLRAILRALTAIANELAEVNTHLSKLTKTEDEVNGPARQE